MAGLRLESLDSNGNPVYAVPLEVQQDNYKKWRKNMERLREEARKKAGGLTGRLVELE